MVRMLSVVAMVALGAGAAFAQTPPDATRPKWGGDISFSVDFSEGTQRGRTLKTNVIIAGQTPGFSSTWRARTRFRGEGAYVTAQKAGAARVASSEVFFGELRQDFHGPPFWVYLVASGYHHLAFALRSEQAYGAGVSYALTKLDGLVVAADLRHIDEHFIDAAPFASWAVRLHQSYSKAILIDQNAAKPRTILFAETFEITPAFESADALQARSLVRIVLPVLANFGVTADFGNDYMRNAPSPNKRHFWKGSLGISVTWGAM